MNLLLVICGMIDLIAGITILVIPISFLAEIAKFIAAALIIKGFWSIIVGI